MPDQRTTMNGAPRTNRRTFFRRVAEASIHGTVLLAALALFTRVRRGRQAPSGARVGLGLMRPPGSLPEPAFLAACIRCTRCADACEPRCLGYFGPEAGASQGTPYIMPIERACTMCLKCGEACPTEAIRPLVAAEECDIGVAKVDDRLCVSINGTGVCGACFTACPLRGRAITQDLRNAPTVHPEYCTGCGLCEQFCIVDERPGLRAIQVVTNREWLDSEAA